jgi:hypothetical protein
MRENPHRPARRPAITVRTFYRLRKDYGGSKMDQAVKEAQILTERRRVEYNTEES